MAKPTWTTLSDRGGEYHSAEHRGLYVEVSRIRGRSDVVGVVSEKSPDDEYQRVERFTARCTIDEAKARVLRVVNRHLDTADTP